MFTLLGPRQGPYCDQVDRRSFLQLGGLALGGLSLPQVLQAQAQAGSQRSHKAVIMVFLSGGPPHQDMVDLKPDAPAEIRGEFKPIRSAVPGIDLCELLPLLSQQMKKWTLIRSIVGSEGRHDAFQCMTGRTHQRQPAGGWPSLGSHVSKLYGPVDPAVPPFVGLSPKMKNATWADPGQPGFLGLTHAPYKPNAEGTAGLKLQGVTVGDLRDRRSLLTNFDGLRREVDATGQITGYDKYTEQALSILTSSKLADALNLELETDRVRDRYGRGSPEPAGYGDAGPLLNDYFLAARRLVEAGVRVVTLGYGRWDWHGKPHGTTFEHARIHFPMFDRGITTLIEDLELRGLDKDVSVVVWGEFGRGPKITKEIGRDHWPAVSFAMLAGGGMKTGQLIGSTNRLGEYAKSRPVTFQEVFATLYRNLGIDVNTATVSDLTGRPQYLVDDGAQPIAEVI
jgi:hypothetical protein